MKTLTTSDIGKMAERMCKFRRWIGEKCGLGDLGQALIESLFVFELFVSASLDELSFLEDNDFIAILNRAEPVSDHKHCAALAF